jgi:hypothetical protein
VERVGEEVWDLVDFALSDMHCLARDCADDKIARKFVAPALELIMLEKALRGGFDREEALPWFGEMYATAIAGDGTVGPRRVELAVGGELGGGAALLRLAALRLFNDLLPDELKFDTHMYMVGGKNYVITAYGEGAARLMRLLAVSAPSAGGGYLSPKFEGFVEKAQVEVRPGGIRLTKGGLVAADLTISEGGVEVKYNVYLRRDDILLQFISTDRGRAELAARLLKLAGVDAEVKEKGGEGEWQVWATTDRLAAGRKELRDALAEIVRKALAKKGWVDAGKAERWLEKLESGRVLKEGWPKYKVGLSGSGALEVRYASTNPDNIEREAQRLRAMGLVEDVHFSVKKPEGGGEGYVSILKEGLAYAAWLSVHGSGDVAEFVKYILQRAGEEGEDVRKKAEEIVDRGREVGSLRLAGFEKKVDGRLVRVIGGGAGLERSKSGKTLLRIKITAEVGGVRGEYTITFGRYGRNNKAMGFATARADAPGGREADAERFSALVEALTGKRPRVRRRNDGTIEIICYEEHLDGFALYAELAEDIRRWLETK